MNRSKKVSQIALLLFLVFSASGSLIAAERQLVDGSIAAPSDYQGDYYLDRNGSKVKIYRKRDTFVVASVVAGTSSQQKLNSSSASLQRMQTQFEDQIVSLTKHNLPGAQVVRMVEPNLKAKGAVTPISGEQLMSSIPGALPMFTSKSGVGDLMLLPKFTVSFEQGVNTEKVIDALEKEFSLTMIRMLNVSGQVYSFSSAYHGVGQFEIARRISQIAGVAWAEPQFFTKPQKSSFTPNDTLFSQQWTFNNEGYRGSRCDADCDVADAWDASGTGATTGDGAVIAIIDDGVQLDHPDLQDNIFINAAETPNNGVDDDANGLVDDVRGYDFVDDTSTACGNDGQAGVDNDANPSSVSGCVVSGDAIDDDNHGTAVAGIAAAEGNNGSGVAGVAFNAKILPIRAISEYETASLSSTSQCNRLAEAIEYAAQEADVLNLSWNLPLACTSLTEAIERATKGEVTTGKGSKRTGGSPVVVASGNNASGWVKVTVDVPAGEHAYEWRYLRMSDDPPADVSGYDDTAWLDDITWPDGATEGFETAASLGAAGFNTDWVLNSCNADCEFNFGGEPVWGINTNPLVNYARSGTKSASINVANAGLESDCGNSYLHILRNGPAGEMSFWVWVSANTQDGFDKFEFLVDGEEVVSYGDLASFGFVENSVGYPANLSNSNTSTEEGVIAVGASTSGDLSGDSDANPLAEYRAPYSQFGPTLDVVASSSDQHLGITTTDRTGDDGFNSSGSSGDLGDTDFTQLFSGTSAAAPVVSGIAAVLIASDSDLSAQQVKDLIKENTDQIGTTDYQKAEESDPVGRNDFFGTGRVSMSKALEALSGLSGGSTKESASCAPDPFDYTVSSDLLLSRLEPQAVAGVCPAQGALPQDETCFVIKAVNENTVVFCL